jgi:molecular chaperone GrpE
MNKNNNNQINNQIKLNGVITFKYNMYNKSGAFMLGAGPITMVVGSDTVLIGLSEALLGMDYTIKNQLIDFNYQNPTDSTYQIVELDLEIDSYDDFENQQLDNPLPTTPLNKNNKEDKNSKKEIANFKKEITNLQNKITDLNKNESLLNEKIIEISKNAQKQINEFKDSYKKQFEVKLKEEKDFQFQSFFEKFLSPLNNLHMAIEFGAKNDGNPELVGYVKGFELLVNQMFLILESSGIIPIEPKIDDEFNPEIHNIVELVQTNEFKKDKIIELRNRGYKLNGRVIMPANVLVSKK